ncbi:MAG: NTP transferase domain-containing protein [Deltaproteobacteria bacterium]|nr:NTP transferase domain-containing protein [Deltaproteobacteria bacterium]
MLTLHEDGQRGPGQPARIRASGMLLIGSASRNAGKTTLACALVGAIARSRPVAAIKVTIVRHEGHGCPRGEEGCGVCRSLDVPFRLSEEKGGPARTDTARLLAAGAKPVLWLCARPQTLASAVRDALGRLEPGTPVVCESNGLRQVVEPDLFVIVRRRGSTEVKPSAREQWPLADAIVESDSDRFLPAAVDFGFGAAGWTLRRQATGVVLAGGRSTRMRRDKALLPLAGRPLIAHAVDGLRSHTEEVLVSAGDAGKYAFLDLPVVVDREPDQGPMMAVASTLERARHDTVLYSPCDVPRLPAVLVARLFRAVRGGEIAVPRDPDGRFEPLLAVYRRSVLPELWRALAAGQRRLVHVYDRCDTRVVPLEPGEELRNVNTAADYAALLGEKR